MNIRALSIAGPFARLIAEGTKEIELRSWETSYRGLVLLHASSGSGYENCFELLEMDKSECPKFSLIGASLLTDCISYTNADLWNRDIDRHYWMGDESYETIRHECYNGKSPIGHVFEAPVLFDLPITDVPGAFNYWLPKNPRQQAGFDKAIAILKKLID